MSGVKTAKGSSGKNSQHRLFKEAAIAVECDPSEASFDRALGKIGRAKPHPKPAPAKKAPRG